MENELSRDFRFGSLMRYALPSIFTFVFIAAYQMVDGFFIATYVGDLAISAVNLIYPLISLQVAIGIMLGAGGNARIVKEMGANRPDEANRAFTQTTLFAAVVGVLCALVFLAFPEPIMRWLGATDVSVVYLRPYYWILMAASPLIILQSAVGILLIGEGKANLTAALCVGGGIINLVLDYVFMRYFRLGIVGAAVATVLGYLLPVAYGCVFYGFKKSTYRFVPCRPDGKLLWAVCFTGSSEMVANVAASVTVLMMNHIIYQFYGDGGISALTVVVFLQFLMQAVFMGFAMATNAVFSFHFGSGNTPMRRRVFRLSSLWIVVLSAGITLLLIALSDPLVGMFFDAGTEIYALAKQGLFFSLIASLFMGFNIFAAGIFTAFSNGAVAVTIAFMRTFVFYAAALLVLPSLMGIIGLWLALPASEISACLVSAAFIVKYRNRYQYL